MTTKGEDIVHQLFGAILNDQGRGYYVALELMALVRGCLDRDGAVLPSFQSHPEIQVVRRSHDFARRLMGEPRAIREDEANRLSGSRALDTIAALARGVRVPVPGRQSRKNWYSEHFQPYVGELIHYDAVYRKAPKKHPEEKVFEVGDKRQRIQIERYFYRGAGGLAHAMLRTDPDAGRLERNRDGLRKLVADSGSPLGQLFQALSAADKGDDKDKSDTGTFKDKPEGRAAYALSKRSVESPWIDLLRDGVRRIVSRERLPRAKRAEALMHWVPYAIARYEMDVSFRTCKLDVLAVPVDFGAGASPLRRRSREVHDRCRAVIVDALETRAEEVAPAILGPGKSRSWRDSARQFFSGTLSAVGALNATTGKRHFVLGDQLLEAVVLAQVDAELPIRTFCKEILHGRLGLVVDQASAQACPDLVRLNSSDMDRNAKRLEERLETLGLLVRYSDATSLVRAEVEG